MAVDWQADILFRPSSGEADENTKLPRFQPVLPEQRQYHSLPLLQNLRSGGMSSEAVSTALTTVTFNKTFLYLVTV